MRRRFTAHPVETPNRSELKPDHPLVLPVEILGVTGEPGYFLLLSQIQMTSECARAPRAHLVLTFFGLAARSTIELIGNGLIAGSAESSFGLYRGFLTSASGAKSWGNNLVSLGGLTTVDIGSGQTTAFTCDFTDPRTPGIAGATPNESQ